MKKMIISLLLVIASIVGIIPNFVQASSSDLFLHHLDFQAEINKDGSMNVTENWNIRIDDTNTLYKTFEIDKTKYSNISNVEVTEVTNGSSQILKKQNQWGYHLPKGNYFGGMNQDNQFEIAWGVGLEDETATKTYKITYQIQDAVAKYNDYAELYWQFVGKDFEIDSKNITGTILLPKHANRIDDIKVWGHTEDLNGEIQAVDTNKIEFNVNQFRAGKYVEIRTLFPTEMIATSGRKQNTERLNEVIEEETKWATQANNRRKMKETTKKVIPILINVVAIIASLFSIKSIIKNIQKIKTMKKIEPTQEIKYYREIPRENATPAQTLAILSKQIKGINSSTNLGKIFSATLLDFSLKNIIEFDGKEKEITIRILQEEAKELDSLKEEKAIFQFLQRACKNKCGEITTKELEKYIKKSPSEIIELGEKIDKHTEQILYEKQIADKKEIQEKDKITGYIVGLIFTLFAIVFIFIMLMFEGMHAFGILLFAVIAIAQLIVFSILASKINILTQEGIDEQAKWKGLKRYMEDFSMLDKREIPEVVIWEKFLVYATVFGIADKVLKQLKVVYPNINEELNGNHYAYMYLMMNTNFSNSFSNAITTSMSTAYSSATGGGGGFSGGGGGRTADGGGGGGR